MGLPMKIKALQTLLFVAASWMAAPSAALADVQLTMQNGRVSVVAKDATVRQILTEWARVGQTKIVNVERIPGGPITLELNNVPEATALEVLLRAISGYIAAPRAVDAANLSRYDRIIVMPTLASARPPAASTPPAGLPAAAAAIHAAAGRRRRGRRRTGAERPGAAGRAGRCSTRSRRARPSRRSLARISVGQQPFMPQPQVIPNGQPAAQPGAQPTAPYGGVAVPGMVAPPPQQPGQPGQPQPQTVPPRRPGGE